MSTLALLPLSKSLAARVAAGMKALGLDAIEAEPSIGGLKAVAPVVLGVVVDPALVPGFTPEVLAKLRRLRRHPLSRLHVLAAASSRQEERAWRSAGADSLRRRAGRAQIAAAIERMARRTRPWVESVSYIGPCRRERRAALVRASASRRTHEDQRYVKIGGFLLALPQEAPAPDKPTGAAAFVDQGDLCATRVRQIRCSLQGLSLADANVRQAFLDQLVSALSLARMNDLGLFRVLEAARQEVLQAGPNGVINEASIDAALKAWGERRLSAGL